MNTKSKKWLFLQLCIILISAIPSRSALKSVEGGPISLWVYPIPLIFIVIFLPVYLKASKPTVTTFQEIWYQFPFKVFSNPVPFYHLGAWACVCAGVSALFYGLIFVKGPKDFSTPFIVLSMGFGGLLGVWLTRRIVERRTNRW